MKKITLLFSLFALYSYGQVGIGNVDPKTSLDINGAISLREGTNLTLANGLNSNLNLGTSPSSFYRITGPTLAFSLRTIIPVTSSDGQLVTLENTTTQTLTLIHDSGTATSKIYCPNASDMIVGGIHSTVTLMYNKTQTKWFVIAMSSKNTKQSSTTYFTTAGLNVTASTGPTYITGYPTPSIAIPENCDVFISGDVGIATTSSSTTGYSSVDIFFIVDGIAMTSAGYQRVMAVNNGGIVGVINYASLSQATTLTAGNHTFGLAASGTGAGSSATVGGNAVSVLQGELTITIINK